MCSHVIKVNVQLLILTVMINESIYVNRHIFSLTDNNRRNEKY